MDKSPNAFLDDSSVIACEVSNTGSRGAPKRQRNGTFNSFSREYGYIDTLQPTYGFITCTERNSGKPTDKRLFFHSSEYSGKFEELIVGDSVEFHEDRNKGKPVAVSVLKMTQENWCILPMIQKGTIVKLNKTGPGSRKNSKKMLMDQNEEPMGSLTYTMNAEYFYLDFFPTDVKEGHILKVGETVTFQITQELWTNAIRAINVCKVSKSQRIKGVISSLKEGYGFIEREDEVKEIYFNYIEYPESQETLELGKELEFTVKHLRNGKEEAVNLKLLPSNTVVFQDISTETYQGTVLRSWDIKRLPEDPLSGRISWIDPTMKCVQLPFGERDQQGTYTLSPGDLVEFHLALDRRDQLQRATQIRLLEETFGKGKEPRDCGMILSVMPDKKIGVILPDVGHEEQKNGEEITFKYKEFLDASQPIEPYQMVGYTPVKMNRVVQEGKSHEGTSAIRIVHLPPASILLENLRILNGGDSLLGVVQQEASNGKGGAAGDDGDWEIGIIVYRSVPDSVGKKEVICYETKDVRSGSTVPTKGDTVEFKILELRSSQTRVAVDIMVVKQAPVPKKPTTPQQTVKPRSHTVATMNTSNTNTSLASNTNTSVVPYNTRREIMERPRSQGWVIVLKDTFGFIESIDHRRDIYFNLNQLRSPTGDSSGEEEPALCLGVEVDFVIRQYKQRPGQEPRGRQADQTRIYAEDVRILPRNSIPQETIVKSDLTGTIIQLARQGNGDQPADYHGIIEESELGRPYTYTLISQEDLRTYLQQGDEVKFSLAKCNTGERAVQVVPLKKPERAKVVGIKDNFGFLDFEKVSNIEPAMEGLSISPPDEVDTPDKRHQLFFHMSAVQEPADGKLEVGDTVEFIVVQSARTGRYSAVNIRRVMVASAKASASTPTHQTEGGRTPGPTEDRPTRLKLKSVCEEPKARLVIIRAPRGPDGTKGFTTPRLPWTSDQQELLCVEGAASSE